MGETRCPLCSTRRFKPKLCRDYARVIGIGRLVAKKQEVRKRMVCSYEWKSGNCAKNQEEKGQEEGDIRAFRAGDITTTRFIS